jgi:hypothetical protein
VCKEKQIQIETNRKEIDSYYIESGYAFANNMELKPELFDEIQSLVFHDLESGVDYRTICKKYIWH